MKWLPPEARALGALLFLVAFVVLSTANGASHYASIAATAMLLIASYPLLQVAVGNFLKEAHNVPSF